MKQVCFAPAGTGKTLLGKAMATTIDAKFFNITASSVASKWHGDAEKMVRNHVWSTLLLLEPISACFLLSACEEQAKLALLLMRHTGKVQSLIFKKKGFGL